MRAEYVLELFVRMLFGDSALKAVTYDKHNPKKHESKIVEALEKNYALLVHFPPEDHGHWAVTRAIVSGLLWDLDSVQEKPSLVCKSKEEKSFYELARIGVQSLLEVPWVPPRLAAAP